MFLRWVYSSNTAMTQLNTISDTDRSPNTPITKIGNAIPALIEPSDT